MDLRHTILTAWNALLVNRSRSLLTVLGIVIGVSAIIIVMALGRGAETLILNQISGLGAEVATIQPGGGGFNVDSLYSRSLTVRDLEALKRRSNVPNLVDAMPQVMVPGIIEHGGERYRPMIIGGNPSFYSEVYDISLMDGEFFDEIAERQNARVTVIGYELADELFGQSRAIGQNVRIQGRQFRVVGVFEEKGTVFGFNMDQLAIIPWTTAQVLTGENHFAEIHVRADSAENVEKMVYDITTTLRETHNIGFGKDDDFNIMTQQNLIEQISLITSVLTAFLSAVVAISLIVGGIGIMNIMLVSVTERTKEIGLRKALGARKQDILRQFLIEAVMITSFGGLIGILIGGLVAFGISAVLAQTVAKSWTFVFPWSGAILGLLVSGGVGLIFGIYPANSAAKKSPIEALRYE